ncbi:phage tail length tape measure family protein [Roseomonas mucosa]|uniref:phage tail length tape measure family protein n=1 Tax=Roseomonas mucosa TaxID=207340 RepID=UPI001EF5AF83|nr:phage tail length tape measure family protein [Roseomonas mucosa]MCG7357136.1 phage tail length tape measure family protein [Roseomonas mucosa]
MQVETEELLYTQSFDDKTSGPATAAKQAVEGLADAFEQTDQVVRRSSASFEAVNRRLDENQRLVAQTEAANRKLASAEAAINSERAKGLITEEQATELIRRAGVVRDESIQKAQRQAEVEAQRWKVASQGAAGYSDQLNRGSTAEAAAARRIEQIKDRLASIAATASPAAAALRRLQEAEEDIRQAQAAGVQVTDGALAGLTKLRQEHAQLVESSGRVTSSTKLQSHEWQNLSFQIQDLVVQVGSGQGLFRPLLQQGPQAVGAVGGVSRAISLVTTALPPARLAMVAVTAAMAAMALAANSQEDRLASLRGQLRALPGDYRTAAEEVDKASKAIARSGLGVDRSAASAGQVTLRQAAASSGVGGLDFEKLGKQAADVAVVLRTDYAGAMDFIAKAMKDPAAAVQELGEKGFPGMTDSLRNTAETLRIGGERGTAFQLVMGKLLERSNGAAKDVSPLTKAMRELSTAWGDFTETVGPWLATAGAKILEWLTLFAKGVGQIVSLIRQVATLTANRIDANGGGNTTAVTSGSGYASKDEDFNTALARQESGLIASKVNTFGYSGLYQYGTARLATLGVYKPSAGESLDGNAWTGSFNIPGFSGVKTQEDFLKSSAAQNAVREIDTARLMPIIEKIMQDNPGMVIGGLGLNKEGLLAVAHLGGEGGMQKFATSGGAYNPRDANGTSLLDYFGAYSKTDKPITVTGTAVTVDAKTGATVTLPEVSVQGTQTDSDRALTRALRLAQGTDPAYLAGTTRETRSAGLTSAMGTIEGVLGNTSIEKTAADTSILTEGLRRMRGELEGLKGPQAEYLKALNESATSAATVNPVQRALNDAVREYDERMKAAGETPTEQGRAEVRAAKLRELGAAYTQAGADATRQLEAEGRLATAWGQGTEAVARLAAEEKAKEVVRQSGAATDQEAKARVEALTESYLALTRAQNDNAGRAANDNRRAEISALEQESKLIGLNTQARETEMNVFRARQEMARKPGGTSEDVQAEAETLIRHSAELKASNDQAKNSYAELSSFASQTFDTISSSITSALADGTLQWKNFGQIGKSVLASLVSEAAKLAILNPLLNGLDGGTRGTLLGLGGSSSGAAGTGALGSVTGIGGMLSKLSDTVSGVGKLFGGSGGYKTGIGFLDNTKLAGNLSTTASLQAGLGIAGGAYGIYSGIQTGGAKGAAQGVAGAAGLAGGASTLLGGLGVAGLGAISTVAPYVAVAAVIASMFLGGQKPSDKTGTSTLNFLTGEQVGGGLGGKRYDQANRNEAASIAASGWQLQDQYKELLGLNQNIPLAYQISVGNRDGIGLRIGDATQKFSRDEQGSQDLAKALSVAIIQAGTSIASNDVKTVVQNSGGAGNIDAVTSNLQWYNDTYKALTATTEATSDFAKSIAELKAPYEAAIEKARSLGLGTEVLAQKMQDATDKAYAARDEQVQSMRRTYDSRITVATGGNTLSNQLATFDFDAAKEVSDLRDTLTSLGFVAGEANGKFGEQVQLERALAAERQQLIDQVETQRRQASNALADRQGVANGYNNTAEGQLASYNRKATEEWLTAARDGITDLTALQITQNAERLALEREYQLKSIQSTANLADRQGVATGYNDTLEGQLASFDRKATIERLQAQTDGVTSMVDLEKTLSLERLKVIADFNKAAEQESTSALVTARGQVTSLFKSLTEYSRSLTVGDASPLSLRDQFSSAADTFRGTAAKAAGGDFSAAQDLQEVAESYRQASKAVNGSGTGYAETIREITAALSQVSDASNALTADAQRAIMQEQTDQVVASIESLASQVTDLKAALLMLMQKPR